MSTSRFLNALAPRIRARLLDCSTLVDLPLRTKLFAREESPRYAYIVTSGMTSEVYSSERGESIELATIGDEGLIGWQRLLGPLSGLSECTMQVGGSGYRIAFADLQREFDTTPEIHQRLLEFVQHQCILSYQLQACNRLHQAQPRFARWLLMAQDRVHHDELHITQEFLADMLGTRRTTVAEIAQQLQKSGAIRYKRGSVRIIDRPLLESHTCECYPLLKKRFTDLYDGANLS